MRTGRDEAPLRRAQWLHRGSCDWTLEKDHGPPQRATSLALVSLPSADWRTIPPHALSLPFYWLPLPAQLLLAGRRRDASLSCAAPSPQRGDGGGRRRSQLRAGAGLCAGRHRRHLPPRQRHNVAPETLRPLPTPDGWRRRRAKHLLLEGDGRGRWGGGGCLVLL